MPHITDIVKYEKLSNGQVSIVVRCCGNAHTDYSHVMAVEVAANSETLKASINGARERCAVLHQQAQDSETNMMEHLGQQVQH